MEKKNFLDGLRESVDGIFGKKPVEEWQPQKNFDGSNHWKTASDVAPRALGGSAPALAHKMALLEEEVVLKKKRADVVKEALRARLGDSDDCRLYERAGDEDAGVLFAYHEAAARQAAFKIAVSNQPGNSEEELELETNGELLKKNLEKIGWLEGELKVVEVQEIILSELRLFASQPRASVPSIKKAEEFFAVK